MTGGDEVTRIRDVYEGYATDGVSARRWDPDQPGNRAILAERQQRTAALVASLPRPPSRVVDLGSGDGDAVTFLRTLLPAATTIVGADLLEQRLAGSRRRHPELAVMAANGAALPLPDGAVDLVSVFTVFSSILDAGLARAVAAEIDRVVAPDGHVLWYDLRRDNPRNRSVRGIKPAEVQALFPGWRVELRSCTVLPPLARRTVPVVAASYRWWSLLPPLRTHHLGLLRRV